MGCALCSSVRFRLLGWLKFQGWAWRSLVAPQTVLDEVFAHAREIEADAVASGAGA